MANDNQIAVKKRLIYAEDLFEPVDFTVLQMGSRGGGKTMAMYEQLFRKRVEMAPTVDAVPVIRCKDCANTCPGNHGLVCTIWGAGTSPDGWCYQGERRES